jgi:hypothetical protein
VSTPETLDPVATSGGAEIVKFQPRNTLTSKVNYARELAQSNLLPRQYRENPPNVLWAIELGEALGISTVTAINGIWVIDGKPTASAALISSLVRTAGHKLRTVGNDKKATAQIIRKDDPDFVFESTWTIERAKQAGLLGKNTWKQYPEAMLKARAVTEVARDACQEALNGCQYTPEELGAEVNEEGVPTTIVEQVSVDWDAEIAACGSDRDALLALHAKAPSEAIKAKIVNAAKAVLAKAQEGVDKAAKEADAAKPTKAEPMPEVVDAEIVEDKPVKPSRQTKLEKGRTASDVFDQLHEAGTVAEVDQLAKQTSRVDVSSFIRDDVREALGYPESGKVWLPEFAAKVRAYVEAHGHSVDDGLYGPAEPAADLPAAS